MANFKITLTLLSILLVGRGALGVVNKLPAQSKNGDDPANAKNEVVAEDRLISDVYNAQSHAADDYSPQNSDGAGFNGPAAVYGPPELTGNYAPVKVHPPPPPELPPPPPQSFGPPRIPKPQYGPPKPVYGLPPLNFGPKPNFGGPKPHFGSPSAPFGSSRPPKPQYGPPFKGHDSPNHQYGPPRFEANRPGAHGPAIPISLENYGPPNKGPSLPFGTTAHKDFAPPPPPPNHGHFGPPADLYGPPPPPPPGVPAPPTPPDIKYDGWQPIAGLIGAPNHHDSVDDSYRLPEISYNDDSSAKVNSVAHAQSSDLSNGHLATGLAPNPTIESLDVIVPSNSYGEPINNPDAHNLQSSVHQSTNSHGLPPPPLPQSEPLHNIQGPAKSIPGHQEQNQHQESHESQIAYPGTGDLPLTSFGSLPEVGSSATDSHIDAIGSSFGSSSSSSFAGSSQSGFSQSSSFQADIGSSLSSASAQAHQTYGPPLTSDSNQHSNSDLLTIQQLPFHKPAQIYGSPLSGPSFGGRGQGHSHGPSGFPLASSLSTDILGPSVPSAFGSGSSYSSSQGPRGGHWPSSFGHFGSSSFHKYQGSGSHYHKNHGPRFGPPPAMAGNLIPPRNRAPLKFRETIPYKLLANVNHYLPPLPKPSINYGIPIEQHLPTMNGPLSFQTAPSKPFDTSFPKPIHFPSNTALAAPNVHYGTPLSFNAFNTPAPVLTYGAPNFGPPHSFMSTTFEGFGTGSNLYNNIANTAFASTYGAPITGHDCSSQDSKSALAPQYNNFAEDSKHQFSSGSQQTFDSSLHTNAALTTSSHSNHQLNNHQHPQPVIENHQFSGYPAIAINELELESHEQQSGEPKDSYNNPIVFSNDHGDQAGAALTNNDIHANAVAASSGFASNENVGQHSHQQNQNSFVSQSTFANDISAEALTAALTAQGYGQSKNSAFSELAQDANAGYHSVPQGTNDALALALQAEGAEGFQIQGSKGLYTLQISAADGSLGTENSDGSIRHDQVLSNGLLQDILAAIERPGETPVQIQGLPQPQQLKEVYDHINLPHEHQIHDQHAQGLLPPDASSNELEKVPSGHDQIGLFYNSNEGDYEVSKKDIRSTAKNEGQLALASTDTASIKKTNCSDDSQVEETKKSS